MHRKSQLGLTGTTFGSYRIDELIGSGGMAAVYKAFDMRLDRHVAVKVLPQFSQTDEYIARFQREAKAMARLFHPNIVSVHDFGQQDGNLYLVMDFIRGGTLENILVGNQIPYLESVNFLLPVVSALGYAHEQGVIHRDVKPANILLDNDKRPVLSDFGIAKINLDDDVKPITRTGVGIGTPDYMAPEQGLGRKVDGRADIYSLGVIFYEMLVGEKPFSQGKGMQVMMMHIMDPFPLASVKVSNLPEKVERVLLRMVEKEASDRYPSMEELHKALLALKPIESSVSNVSGLFTEESMFLELGKRKEGDTICPGCSSATYEGDKYCSQCGEKLTDDTNQKKDSDRSILKRSQEIMDAPKTPSVIPTEPEIGSGSWYLTVITGTQPGREYALQDRMMFGRNESNAVWVNNNNASRQHAMIEKIELAKATAQNGDIPKGLEVLFEALKNAPDNDAFIHIELANFCSAYNTELTTVGLPSARRALLIDGDTLRSLNAMGNILFALNDLDSAERYYLRALEQEPGDLNSLFQLGMIAYQRENTENTRYYFQTVLSLSSPYSELYAAAQRMLESLGQDFIP